MSKDKGWIKISRKMLEWRHFKDADTLHVFLTLMLQAYPKPKLVGGKLVEAGQVVTSISKLMEATGIKSNRDIIKSLQKLIASGEIKKERLGNDSVVTICNFKLYQGCGNMTQPKEVKGCSNMTQPKEQGCSNMTQPKEQGCSNMTQPVVAIRHNLTYFNEDNKLSSNERINKEMLTHSIKETGGAPKNGLLEDIKKEPKIGYEKFGEDGLVELKPVEHRALVERYGEDAVKNAIEDLNDKLAAGGDDNLNNARSHYHVLRYWLRYRKDSGSAKPQPRGEYRPFKPFED